MTTMTMYAAVVCRMSPDRKYIKEQRTCGTHYDYDSALEEALKECARLNKQKGGKWCALVSRTSGMG